MLIRIIQIFFILTSFSALSFNDLTITSKVKNDVLTLNLNSKEGIKFSTQKYGNSLIINFKKPCSVYFIDLPTKISYQINQNNRHIFNQDNNFFDNINMSSDGMQLLINLKYDKFLHKNSKSLISLSDFENKITYERFNKLDLLSNNEVIKTNGITNFEEKIVFPWNKEVAASSFMKQGYLWIVFNKPKKINIKNIIKSSSFIESIEQIKSDRSTILQIKISKKDRIAKLKKKHKNWILEFSKDSLITKKTIKEYKSNNSLGMFFPASKFSDIIKFKDPIIGDEIITIPFYQEHNRVKRNRNMIDFKVSETIQGFSIFLKNDNVETRLIRSGIEVISPNFTKYEIKKNLQTLDDSGEKEDVLPGKFKSNPYSKSILPFKDLRKLKEYQFSQNKEKYWYDFINSSQANKQEKMLDLIKFIFKSRMYSSTIGLLDQYNLKYPNNKFDTELLLMRVISEYGMNHFNRALKILANIEQSKLDDLEKEEVDFWNKLLKLLSGRSSKRFPYYENVENFLNTYPIKMQVDLGIIAAEHNIKNNKVTRAKNIINFLKSAKHDDNTENNLKFLEALVLQQQQKFEDSMDLFEELSSEVDDRKNRLRSSIEIIKQKLNLEEISINDAIKDLNKLRFVWRGDAIEAHLLKILGELYNIEGNYINSLRTYKELASNIASKSDILEITTKMGKTFTKAILENHGKYKLDDFKIMSLYYEFQELTPIGKMGDKVARVIADKLFNLDLLDESIEILEHQLNFRSSKSEKIGIANKLALIYLLDNKPRKALDTLEKTDKENFTYENFTTKIFLKAQALTDLKKFNEALKIISRNNEDEALEIRVKTAILQNDLEKLKDILEPYLTERGKQLSKLNNKDSGYVLQLAISYILSGDFINFDRLYNIFIKIISEENDYKRHLNFLYSSKQGVDYNNLKESLEIDKIESFMNEYRKKLFTRPEL